MPPATLPRARRTNEAKSETPGASPLTTTSKPVQSTPASSKYVYTCTYTLVRSNCPIRVFNSWLIYFEVNK